MLILILKIHAKIELQEINHDQENLFFRAKSIHKPLYCYDVGATNQDVLVLGNLCKFFHQNFWEMISCYAQQMN